MNTFLGRIIFITLLTFILFLIARFIWANVFIEAGILIIGLGLDVFFIINHIKSMQNLVAQIKKFSEITVFNLDLSEISDPDF